MKKYRIYYSFEGNGETTIKAKDEEEARDIFINGDWEAEREEISNQLIDELRTQ